MKLSRRKFFAVLAAGGAVLAGARVSFPETSRKPIAVEVVLDWQEGIMQKNLLYLSEGSTVYDATTLSGFRFRKEGSEKTKRFLPVIEHMPNMYYRVNGKDILDPIGLDYPLKDGDVVTWSTS